MKNIQLAGVATALILLTPNGALAESDYLLTLDGVSGGPLQVQSWSWGASNSGSMASSRRDAASGQASGRRVTSPPACAAPSCTSDLPQAKGTIAGSNLMSLLSLPEVSSMSMLLPRQQVAAAALCSSSSKPRSGRVVVDRDFYDLSDVKVTSCSNEGEWTRVAITGRVKHEKTGHVTLMR